MERITRADAQAQGFTIDDCVYPPCAYKGPRFRPTVCVRTYTELEEELREKLNAARAINAAFLKDEGNGQP